jgi:thiol-disulfide isomerase/thioredoxin
VPRHLTVSLAVAAILVAACGATNGATRRQDNAVSNSAVSAGQTAQVPAQLRFSAETLGGQPFSGKSLVGKPSVLWFWTSWCPQCQREAPMVSRVAAANPAVTFIGVAAHDQVSAMQAFVAKYRLGGFTELADTDGMVWAKFGVTHQPAYAFVDSHDNIDVVKGSLPESQLIQRVRALTGR